MASPMDSLEAKTGEVRDELRRADTKATTLLTLVGATFAGVITLTQKATLPAAAEWGLWLAASPIACSVLVLLSVVCPFLGAGEPGSFLHAARVSTDELVELHTDSGDSPQRVATTLQVVSRIARRKYRRIRAAVQLLVAGLLVLLVALAIVGGA